MGMKSLIPKCYITLTYEYHQRHGVWVGICKETGTATSHENLEKLEKELNELVLLHLNSLEDLAERERFFKENNIKLYEIEPKTETIRLPIPDNVFIQTRTHQVPAVAGACN